MLFISLSASDDCSHLTWILLCSFILLCLCLWITCCSFFCLHMMTDSFNCALFVYSPTLVSVNTSEFRGVHWLVHTLSLSPLLFICLSKFLLYQPAWLPRCPFICPHFVFVTLVVHLFVHTSSLSAHLNSALFIYLSTCFAGSFGLHMDREKAPQMNFSADDCSLIRRFHFASTSSSSPSPTTLSKSDTFRANGSTTCYPVW